MSSDARPSVTVATVVARNGEFLFVEERVDGRLVLNQPAGHLEPDESLFEAAIRETREETGWHIEVDGLIAVYQWRAPGTKRSVVRFTFSGKPISLAHDSALDEGIVRALWLSREAFSNGGFALRTPMVARSVDDYLNGAAIPLSAIQSVAEDIGA